MNYIEDHLSPRQRAVLKKLGPVKFAREFPYAGGMKEIVHPDGTREKRFDTPTGGYSIRVKGPKPKPQPLQASVQFRVNRVETFNPQALSRFTQQRIARVLGESVEQRLARYDAQCREQEIADHLRTQPRALRPALQRLFNDWSLINKEFFCSKLALPRINLIETKEPIYARCFYKRRPVVIDFEVTEFDPQYPNRSPVGAWASLVHEMVHQFNGEVGHKYTPNDYATGGHGEEFTAIANLIGKELGFPAVRCAAGSLRLDDARCWPHGYVSFAEINAKYPGGSSYLKEKYPEWVA